MRKTLVFSGVTITVWIAWLVWPLSAVYALLRAVEARDGAAVVEQLDVPSIRRSLTGQIIEAYNRITGAKINRNSLTIAAASAIADPLVAQIMSKDGVETLLQNGWVPSEVLARPDDAQGLTRQALGDAWQIFLNSHRGFDEYSISFPADKPDAQRFELQWRLRGLKWRLAEVRLPPRLIDQLAQGLVKLRPGG